MEITLATVGHRTRSKGASTEDILDDYCQRIGRYVRCGIDKYATEERFFAAIGRMTGGAAARGSASRRGNLLPRQDRNHRRAETGASKRTTPLLLLLDSRGRSFSSEQFAQWLQREREQGTRNLLFAVGPPDGWSDAARSRAAMLLSLGPMTLPHELAAVVLAEQIYRAFTIVEGHPYHLGHA